MAIAFTLLFAVCPLFILRSEWLLATVPLSPLVYIYCTWDNPRTIARPEPPTMMRPVQTRSATKIFATLVAIGCIHMLGYLLQPEGPLASVHELDGTVIHATCYSPKKIGNKMLWIDLKDRNANWYSIKMWSSLCKDRRIKQETQVLVAGQSISLTINSVLSPSMCGECSFLRRVKSAIVDGQQLL
jgi:hypothetical protein